MSKITRQELIRLQKTLGTDEAIGKKFNVTRQAIHQMRKKFGVGSNYAGNPERNKNIAAAFKKGSSCVALAEKYALSISQTNRIINDAAAAAASRKKSARKVTGKKK